MKGFFQGGRSYLLAVAVVVVLAGFHGGVGNVMAVSQVTYEKLKVFSEVYALIKKNYVEDVDEEEILYGAISGMLETLDPHSSFLDPESFKEMKVDTRGEFGGLGIEITRSERAIKVVSPIEDTPAYRAGMKAGDLIIKIEDESTQGMGLLEAVKKMRGKPGTKITLTVFRKDHPKPIIVKIIRAIIKIRSVKWRMERDDVAYIRLIQFNEQSYPMLVKAIKALRKEKKFKGVVLDLRNNPGGLLDQAVQVADAFLNSGRIVYTKGRISGKDMSFDAHDGDLSEGVPIVVLINSGSASASEIVSGALQDHRRAVIMGTPSFGKGSVQTIIPLVDGSGLRLTTAQYYTPNGRSIQAKGISPDIEVEDLKVGDKRIPYERAKEKDLKGHLIGLDEDEEEDKTSKKSKKDKKSKKKKRDESSDDEAPGVEGQEGEAGDEDDPDSITGRSKKDYQLQRALDLLKSYHVFQQRIGSAAKTK